MVPAWVRSGLRSAVSGLWSTVWYGPPCVGYRLPSLWQGSGHGCSREADDNSSLVQRMAAWPRV
eukprot:1078250-Prymnesium_polylepis.1